MRRLAQAIEGLEEPAVEKIAKNQQEDPFQVLIATMLSAQTKDAVTAAASERLFDVARTPDAIAKLPESRIEKLIYPVSFYRNKAVHVRETCRQLVARYGGRVPSTMEELLTLPGVGRKTANLHAGENRARALRRRSAAMVAGDQPLSRHVGTERVPSGVSSVPAMRPRRRLPADRSDENWQVGQTVIE
jgi:transposase